VAVIVFEVAVSFAVVQVALPLELIVTAGQSELELPLILKVTVPDGDTAKGPPASWAVKVTAVLTLVELDGDAATPMVVASLLTVCDMGAAELSLLL
jgi:hypothetical protein